ncbi:probable protein phosphatase 2C 37 [Hordeum vulgare subsp. vulgare]|uniref:probable protein phosphatase 2C 37 n=1 Tax=Hordeum vulgare subsp. vulgare TaxID=112509 RepID=UPI001D1A45FF|nr:probable protein phosphatase 2C 37 [Hordeum vulgare subsp. vulgare]
MANAGVNNVPAAVELGADDPALASVEGEVESPPPSSGYNASSEGSEEYLTSGQEGEGSGAVPAPLLPAEAAAAAAAVWSLAFGSASERGQDHGKRMEDAVSLRPFFCAWADGSPMHFFAVFDGHGGPQVSALCRDQMHVILAEELAGAATAYRKEHPEKKDEEAERRAWEAALKRSFERADALGMGLSESGWPIVGSTAVVALVVRDSIVVANCGDSRAVLCRAGNAAPLSEDHKVRLAASCMNGMVSSGRTNLSLMMGAWMQLERADERARADAAGGKVRRTEDGQLRVQGVLAMSRALGTP